LISSPVSGFCITPPNVTYMVRELGRVTKSGGYMLLREPVISMGDSTEPRAGVTPHERGIPGQILLRQVDEAGFVVEHETRCFFSGMSVAIRLTKRPMYDKNSWTEVDEVASRLFAFNYRYHATTTWGKLRPRSSFLVLRRR
jgi:hypothetical protein